MIPQKNTLLRLAFVHTLIIFIALHVIGLTGYFYILPYSKPGFTISYAERLVKNLTEDVKHATVESLTDFMADHRNLYLQVLGKNFIYSNAPDFFSRYQPDQRADGHFQLQANEGLYYCHNDTIHKGALAGSRVLIARDAVFFNNTLYGVIIRYEFLVLLICLVLFYVFLLISHIQLKNPEIHANQVEAELNVASLIYATITCLILLISAISYFQEGLMYALFHQMRSLLNTTLSDSPPLVNGLIFTLLVVVEVISGTIPGTILYPVGGILFGTFTASAYILIGTLLGSSFGYFQGRAISLSFREHETRAAEFTDYIKKRGAWGVYILRANPITSFSFINYVSGVLRVSFPRFLIATVLGRIPIFLFGTFAGLYLFENYKGAMPIIGIGVFAYLLYWGVRTIIQADRFQKQYLQLYVTNVARMGAAIDSSDFLARKMIDHLPQRPNGCILELGPGTGVITQRIIEKQPPDARIVTVEANDVLARHLRGRFQNVTTISGDARHLSHYLRELRIPKVDIVVSGLPFLSFPQTVTEEILDEVKAVLKEDGYFVLFQYTLVLFQQIKSRFRVEKVTWTPLNIPPAFVLTCRPLGMEEEGGGEDSITVETQEKGESG
jgi:phospholipid N-methyltransferase/uncharacterized membrane protein YdjX (TVP38/TMEM64 family)